MNVLGDQVSVGCAIERMGAALPSKGGIELPNHDTGLGGVLTEKTENYSPKGQLAEARRSLSVSASAERGRPKLEGGSNQELADSDLVRRSLSGDKEAYRVLVEKYQQRLFACAVEILKNREDAEDVVQESFVKAYLSLREFQGRSSFYTWIYRIVYNMCIDYRRKFIRRGGAPVEYDEEVGFGQSDVNRYSPAEELLRKQQSGKIQEVLKSISEDHRRVIVLRELDGMSYEEISQVVGISTGTVMSRLHYARKKLQAALQEFAPFGRSRGDEGEKNPNKDTIRTGR